MIKLTSELAEICGIHAGDGHLRKNGKEFEISGNYEEKEYYDEYMIPLFKKVYQIKIKGQFFKSKKTYGFRICNKEFCKSLNDLGFPLGAKTKIVAIPKFIIKSNNNKIKSSFIRGLFDTDGCITFMRKKGNYCNFKKEKHYYPRIIISSCSQELIIQSNKIISSFNIKTNLRKYEPKSINENTKWIISIYGNKNINNWMKKIGSNNSTKISRYKIWKMHSFCPPNTTFEERKSILKGKLNPNSLYGGL